MKWLEDLFSDDTLDSIDNWIDKIGDVKDIFSGSGSSNKTSGSQNKTYTNKTYNNKDLSKYLPVIILGGVAYLFVK